MKLLGALERPFYATVNPLVERLIRAGVRPNTITTIGTGLVLVSAVAYGFGQIRLGGLLLLLSGVTDTLDGQVARGGAMVTKFGAFYDSTLDRVGDGATFIGIGAFLLTAPDVAYRVPAVDHLHGRHPQLAPGLLRASPGRRARARVQGGDRAARGADTRARALLAPHRRRAAGPWCSRRWWRSWPRHRSSPWSSGSCTSTGRRRRGAPPRGRARRTRYSRERTIAVADQTARQIAPAKGKLGVLCVGLGAVATTFIAGVENIRRGSGRADRLAHPDGHHPPRQAHRKPLAADQATSFRSPTSTTSSSAPGTRSPTTPTRPRCRRGVLDRHEHIEPIADFLKAIKPMPAVFDQYVRQAPRRHERQAGQDQAGAGRGARARTSATSRRSTSATASSWSGAPRPRSSSARPGPLDARRLREGDGRERPDASRPRCCTPTPPSWRACPSPTAPPT